MKIVVLESLDEEGLKLLRAVFSDVIVALGLSRAAQLRMVRDAAVVVVRSVVQVDEEFFSHAPLLRCVGRAGVGTDNIDIKGASARDIAVLTVPGGNSDSAADFAVMQMLCLVRHAYTASSMVAASDFRRARLNGRQMSALTTGLIGLGNVGSRIAKRLTAFGSRVVGYDPAVNADDLERMGVESMTLAELLSISDVVSIQVPLNASTRGLIQKREFAQMKRGAVLINISRGAVVSETDLRVACEVGIIGAVAIDVLEHEPPFDLEPGEHDYDNPLLHVPNVYVTPHMAANTFDAQRQIAISLCESLIRKLRP